MRSAYRAASALAVAALLGFPASDLFPAARPSPTHANGGWNPCTVWANYGLMHHLAFLVTLTAFLVFAVQGLRKQSGPRWLAMSGLISLALAQEDAWWTVVNCYTKPTMVASWVLCAATASMLLLHACRPFPPNPEPPADRRPIAVALKCVPASFFSLLLAWFALCQFVLLTAPHEERFVPVIVAVHRWIAVPAALLFPFALGISAYRWKADRAAPPGPNEL